MSFWEEEGRKKKAIIGDEPIDILIDAFEEIKKIYNDELGRNPTINEIETLIKVSLEGQEDNIFQIQNSAIQGCTLNIKKYKTVRYGTGYVFAITLKKEDVYSYGKILKGDNKDKDNLFIEYYDLFTKKPLTIRQFIKSKKDTLFIADTGVYSIINGEWKKIGKEYFDESTFVVPDFFGVIDGKYYISKGASGDPQARVPATKDEAERVKNPDGLIGSGIIEEWLTDAYERSRGRRK